MLEAESFHSTIQSETQIASRPSRRLLRQWRLVIIGGSILLVILLVSLLAPVISPYDKFHADLGARLKLPGSPGHLLGTDRQGKDILSQLILGAPLSLFIAIVPVSVAGAIGVVLGAVAGYIRHPIEDIILRSMDVLFGLPPIMLAIAIAATLGPSLLNMVIAMTVILIPPMTRVVYQEVVSTRNALFISAARSLGYRDGRIIFHHILPNVVAPVIAYATGLSGLMIVFGAGLSFLGLGVQPPEPDWGRMMNEGQGVLPVAPHVSTLPGLAIFIVAIAFNLLGEGLRDVLDPHRQP